VVAYGFTITSIRFLGVAVSGSLSTSSAARSAAVSGDGGMT